MIQKAKVLTLIVFGLLFTNLSAQGDDFSNDPNAKLPDDDRKFRFGLQFSPNISWFKTNTVGYESNGTKMGFSYGLSFEYFMSNNYLFSSGINFLKTGGVFSYKGAVDHGTFFLPSEVEVNYSLHYVEIPTILKLRTNEIGYLTYFGQIGLKTGFNFKASSTTTHTYFQPQVNATLTNTLPNVPTSVTNEINFINMSLVVGAGVEYSISGNTSLMLGITYSNGFINQLDTKVNALDANGNALIDRFGSPVYTAKDASANLNYFALNIGVYF